MHFIKNFFLGVIGFQNCRVQSEKIRLCGVIQTFCFNVSVSFNRSCRSRRRPTTTEATGLTWASSGCASGSPCPSSGASKGLREDLIAKLTVMVRDGNAVLGKASCLKSLFNKGRLSKGTHSYIIVKNWHFILCFFSFFFFIRHCNKSLQCYMGWMAVLGRHWTWSDRAKLSRLLWWFWHTRWISLVL